MKVTDTVKNKLTECNAEFLVEDLKQLLEETNLTKESLSLKLVLTNIDFSSSTAILLIKQDDRIVVSKSYPYSKVKSSLSLKYKDNLIQ